MTASADRPAPYRSPRSFVEPTETIPLRYGTHHARWAWSLALLFGGGITMQFGSVYTFGLLVLGLGATIAGWCVVPSAGWRRCTAILPGVLAVAALLNGAASGVLLALALGGWLLVRMRPLRSHLVLPLPAIAALLLGIPFPQYGEGVVVGTALGLVIVGSAWLARSLAAFRPPRFAAIFQRRQRDRPVN